jgi:hypothetical protein
LSGRDSTETNLSVMAAGIYFITDQEVYRPLHGKSINANVFSANNPVEPIFSGVYFWADIADPVEEVESSWWTLCSN